jgi:hypothetical protein
MLGEGRASTAYWWPKAVEGTPSRAMTKRLEKEIYRTSLASQNTQSSSSPVAKASIRNDNFSPNHAA